MAENKEPAHKPLPGWVFFVIGGTSGMMSISIVQPMDLVKTRMQLLGMSGSKMSAVQMIREIRRKEGFKGFYTGISAALFRQATYTTGRLGCFYTLLDAYKTTYGVTPSYGTKWLTGIFSGGVGAFVGTPAEVVLIRMTADGRLPPEKRRNYKHVFHALARITREEGVTTLWRGVEATITKSMVVNGAQLSTYAQAREALLPRLGEGFFLHFCSSLIAGFITCLASLPLDIVKTRVQTAEKGASQIAVLMSVIKNEGVLGLWTGLWPAYGKTGPNTVLTFTFVEQLHKLYRKFG